MKILPEPVVFEWDKGNIGKNLKHNVADKDSEEVFDNPKRFFFEDKRHSSTEQRYGLYGITDKGRKLSLVFTTRKDKIRIITARDMSKLKIIPKFRNEDEERNFWATHDLTDYFDMSKPEQIIFPNLKRSTESISLRLSQHLLARIKELANIEDVPYQSLMKIFLAERVAKELKGK